jgi:hypothetical protein
VYRFTQHTATVLKGVTLLALTPTLASSQDRSLPEVVRRADSAVVLLRACDVTGSLLGVGSGFVGESIGKSICMAVQS